MTNLGNNYQKLISTAQRILVENGSLPSWPDELASFSGLSETDVTANFSSAVDLKNGLIYQGIALLNDAISRGLMGADIDNPVEQLNNMARSYAVWASENTALFELISRGLNEQLEPDSDLYRFTVSMRDLIQRKLHQMQMMDILSQDAKLDQIVLALHCMIKGTNNLFITSYTDPWLQDSRETLTMLAPDMFAEFLRWIITANAPQKPSI